jgi:excisionase family DNA binding protein
MSRQEAASQLGLTMAQVDDLIATGLLDRYRIRGTYIRVRRDQVDELAQVDRSFLIAP